MQDFPPRIATFFTGTDVAPTPDVIATGPHFVTRADAGQALELSRRAIR